MTVLARSQRSWCYAQWNLSAIDNLVCPCCRDYCNTTQGIILQGMWTLRWIYRSCRIKCERGFVRLYQVLLVTFPEALVTRSARDNVPAPESAKALGAVMFLHSETWPLECNARHNHLFCLLTYYWNIFGPQRDDVTGEWRRLHNKELYALYYSPNIIRLIISRWMRWAGHVARME